MITELKELDLNKTYSYADYLRWRLKERIELLRGKIVLMPPAPSMSHQRISRKLLVSLDQNISQEGCEAFSAPFDVRLSANKEGNDQIYTVVQPDICVVCDPKKLDEKGCIGAPELVIEILSPGNSRKEMKDKFRLYEEAGVLEYWIVSIAESTVLIYERNNNGKFVGCPPLTDHDILESKLFPGLQISLFNIFD